MKTILHYLTVFALLFLLIPFQTIAQPSGELIIYSTPITPENTLDAVIAADQASATPHAIYTLASTDTPYVFDAGIVINNDVTIRGILNAQDNNRPPCIQPNVLFDGSVPGHLFTFTKSGSVIRIENLYLLGISIENSVNWGDGWGITVNGDNIKTYIDNVVFEQWSQFAINYSGDWNSFWITNCKFRNMVNTGSVYTGEAFRQRNDLGTVLTDTVIIKQTTFLAVNAYAMCSPVTGYMNYGEFSHNTVVGMVKNPFFSMNITNWRVAHNIFYDTYAGGMSNGEFPWWDRIWAGGLGSTIDLDPLNKLNAVRSGIDTTLANWSELAEAARTIDVVDNIYFRSPAIDAFIQSVNDTATTANDTIHLTPWMNEVTSNMFADDAAWPGLNDEGNLIGTDPQLGAAYANLLGAEGTTVPAENGVGLIPYISAARKGGGNANVNYGYNMAAPDYSSGNWKPIWPLPEYSDNLLNYSADLTATDGLRYGDQFWFTGVTDVEKYNGQTLVPDHLTLNQNYPNPFNPSTTIKFQIPEAGNVRLKIFDIMGEEVRTIIDNSFKAKGSYQYTIDFSDLASGVYYYKIEFGGQSISKKMLLLK